MADYRSIKYAKETTWGTAVSVSTNVNFIKESISTDRSMNYNETVGYLEPITQSTGKYKIAGVVDTFAVPDEIDWLLYSLFGTVSSASLAAGTYQHTFTPDPTMIHYTVQVDKDTLGRKYTSLWAKGATIKILPDKDVQISWDVNAQKDTAGLTPASPTFTSYPQSVHGVSWTPSIGGSTRAEVMSCEIKLTHEDDTDNYNANGIFLQTPHRGMFKTQITCDLQFDDDDELQRFYDGTTTSTTPTDTVTPFNVTNAIQGDCITGTHQYGLTITTPKVTWSTEKSNMDRRNKIIQNVVGTAIYDSTYGVRVQLTNRTSSLG